MAVRADGVGECSLKYAVKCYRTYNYITANVQLFQLRQFDMPDLEFIFNMNNKYML